ncbi:hypothetical protein SCHPADRAFT_901185 [Schizopora paradoxa]|uniref:Uncharacterized protein n=1 Tax=Schizopora paradoxa TaxID=27342 RepID=A0A0H2RZ13_9AGAM|nr:hypothetical protein SCHPADRAFT_901185 [Schizopora paradoxa]
MKFFGSSPLASFVFLLGAGSALGATIYDRASSAAPKQVSAKDKCPTAKVVTTTTIQVGNAQVNRTTFACPDDSLRQASQNPPPSTKQLPTGSFARRNAAECRNPAPECQCGQSFVCNCQNVTATAPLSTDCATLISATQVVAQAEGPTFTVEPDNFELISFGTCALEWTNFACETLEYCWDELGNTGGVVNQLCFEQGGGTAAACNANDDLWLLQSLRVGS